MVVFGSPTWGGKPPKKMEEYLMKLADLNRTIVVLIATSIASKEAIPIMKDLVSKANGKVVDSLIYHIPDYSATEKSHQAGFRYT